MLPVCCVDAQWRAWQCPAEHAAGLACCCPRLCVCCKSSHHGKQPLQGCLAPFSREWCGPASCAAGCPAANVASLPDKMLSAGQPKLKLQEDLNAAKNSVDLLAEMLAPISLDSPADVKQVPPWSTSPAAADRRVLRDRVTPPTILRRSRSAPSSIEQQPARLPRVAPCMASWWCRRVGRVRGAGAGAGAGAQEYVVELAQKCEMMLPQLARLAEADDLTDEKNLDRTLVVHAEMEESLAKYHRLLAVRARPARSLHGSDASQRPLQQQLQKMQSCMPRFADILCTTSFV